MGLFEREKVKMTQFWVGQSSIGPFNLGVFSIDPDCDPPTDEINKKCFGQGVLLGDAAATSWIDTCCTI